MALLAHIIEDVTLIKMPAEGTTKIHVRVKGGKIQTLITMSPRSSAQQVKTPSGIVELADMRGICRTRDEACGRSRRLWVATRRRCLAP
ncbi:hypothetical protein [Bradyrhizobium sp. JR3.5]